MLLTIQCLERSSLGHGLHHDLMTFYHICIKRVQRLTVGHHDVVGDIHNIIDGAQTHGRQFLLQPVGTLLHFAVSY